MADAWNAQSRDLPDIPEDEARAAALKAYSPVLSNRKPPYSLAGGLFDAMCETAGTFYVPTDEQAKNAGELFQKLEGIDLDKAAQVCLASLFIAKENGVLGDDHAILVNLTGGGAERAHADGLAIPATPDYVFTKAQDNLNDIRNVLGL